MIEDLAQSQEENMQALKRDVMLGVAKAIASPAVSQSLAREVKDEITRVDSRLSAVEEHLQQTRDTIGEQAQRMKVTLTLQEEVREASMEHLMDQQHELS
jgi:alcohol dehydrogenase class IV